MEAGRKYEVKTFELIYLSTLTKFSGTIRGFAIKNR
jgi:hypothetical protein